MATTPTTRVTALARRMRVDIDTATYPASNYQQLLGLQELKLMEELRTTDDESYEDAGAAREAVTGYNWRLEGKLLHSTNAAGTSLDVVHAYLRNMFDLAKAGNVAAAEFGVRWYDRTGLAGDSKEGRCYVKAWPAEGGAPGAQDLISVVIQGQGPLASITNPAGSLLPVVSGLTPAAGGVAGGQIFQIFGRNFSTVTGAGGVKLGVTNATAYAIVNDSTIVAVAPAKTAGTYQVIVTNPTGASVDTAADDFVYS